jgi:tetratricopeptide (TPR) repeat protein
MKLHSMKATLVLMLALFSVVSFGQALKVPAPSPQQTIKQAFALSEISITYCRPSAKGRTVFGDVVQYGQIWRTGANGASTITFGEDVTVEGKAIKAGTYAIYSIPNKESWDIMLYSDLELGGNVGEYNKEKEVARFAVKARPLAESVETFTINVADQSSNTASIEMSWEKTRVSFRVEADIDSKIMKNIESAVIKDNKPYYQAASYYYENNKDLNLALEWINKAVANNPNAYWVHMLKAKIQFKAKDTKGAKETALKVVELAKADGDDAYVRMAEKLIAEIK